MKDTTAFAIVKELKAPGHTVFIEDQPKTRRTEENSAAVIGDKDMSLTAIEHCVDFIRDRMMKENSPTSSKQSPTRSASSRMLHSRRGKPTIKNEGVKR